MQVSVTFKNLDPSDALRSYAQKKLDRFDKLLDNPAEANVVFSVEKIRHTAEISLASDKLTIHAKEESESMYSSIDIVVDKLKKQLTKTRDKINKRATASRDSIKNSHLDLNDSENAEDDTSSYDDDDPQTESYSGGAQV